jgi:hypothetical protein
VAAGPGNRAPADPVGRQPPAAGGRARPAGGAPSVARAREMLRDGLHAGTAAPPRPGGNPLRPARAPVGGRQPRRSPPGRETVGRDGRAGPGDRPGQPARARPAGRGRDSLRAPAAGPGRMHQLLPDAARPGPGAPPGAGALAGRPARPGGEGAAGAAQLAEHAHRPGVRRPAVRDRQGQVGPDRPGSSRLARLHPHHPGVAARVRQGMGRPRPAAAAGQAGGRPAARDRRRDDQAVGRLARRPGRPGRGPCRPWPRRHRGVLAPPDVPGRRRAAVGLLPDQDLPGRGPGAEGHPLPRHDQASRPGRRPGGRLHPDCRGRPGQGRPGRARAGRPGRDHEDSPAAGSASWRRSSPAGRPGSRSS